MSRTGLHRRVAAAAGEALARRKFITVADVCIGLGWLTSSHVDRWRQGRVPDLESFLPVHDDKLAQIPVYLQRWAEANALKPAETDYVAASRDRRPLRFTSTGDPATRSAAGRSLDEKAITLAVVAAVRHEDTDYDSLLMSGVPRDVARERIKPAIERVLGAWA